MIRQLRAGAVFVLLELLFVGRAAATEFVGPGKTDFINWQIINDAESVSDAADVQISVRVTPDSMAQYFHVDTAQSTLGPLTIAKGQAQTFKVKYTIDQAAPDGATFNVTLLAKTPTEGALPTVGNLEPDGSIRDASVSFTSRRPKPTITLAGMGGTIDIQSFEGEYPTVPSALPGVFDVSVRVATGSIKSLRIFADNGYSLTIPENLGSFFQGQIGSSESPAAPGLYTIEAVSSEDGLSKVQFRVHELTFEVSQSDARTTYLAATGKLRAKVPVSVSGDVEPALLEVLSTEGEILARKDVTALPATIDVDGETGLEGGMFRAEVVLTDAQGMRAAKGLEVFTANRTLRVDWATNITEGTVSGAAGYYSVHGPSGTIEPPGSTPNQFTRTNTVVSLWGSGRYESRAFDLAEGPAPLFPGAVIAVDLADHLVDLIGASEQATDPSSAGPIVSVQQFGRASYGVLDAASAGAPSVISEGPLVRGGATPFHWDQGPVQARPLSNTFKLTFDFEYQPQSAFVECWTAEAGACLKGKSYSPALLGFSQQVYGQSWSFPATDPTSGAGVGVGMDQTVPIGAGVVLSELDITQRVRFSVSLIPVELPVGMEGYKSSLGYRVGILGAMEESAIAGPFRVHLPFDPAGLTPAQLDGAVVVRDVGTGSAAVLESTWDPETNSVSAVVDRLGTFVVAVPIYAAPNVAEGADFRFDSGTPVTAAPRAASEPAVEAALRTLHKAGEALAGPLVEIGPTGTTFTPAAWITLALPNIPLVSPEDMHIVQFSESGAFQKLQSQRRDVLNGKISAEVPSLSSIFGVFFATTPLLDPDAAAPITQVALTPIVSTSPLVLGEQAQFSLSAVDTFVLGSVRSGVLETRFLLDQMFADPATTPGVAYLSPVSVSPGTHTLVYYSIDHAHNVEVPRRVDFSVRSSSSPPPAAQDQAHPLTWIEYVGYLERRDDGSVTISTATGIALHARDPGDSASGVKETRFSIGDSAKQVFGSTFTLSLGTQTLSYYSVDFAGNIEPVNIATLTVVALSEIPPPPPPPPSQGSDLTPPITSLLIDGDRRIDPESGFVYITTRALVGLLAFDPAVEGAVTSGLATTYFLLDQPFVDLESTPPSVGTGPFVLALGTRTLSFASVDRVGNFESVRVATLVVVESFDQPPPPPEPSDSGRGLAVAVDGLGRIWTVGERDRQITVGRYDANGALQAETNLHPAMSDEGSWHIKFDAQGNAYVVGSSKVSETSSGGEITVYKLTADVVPVSSATFNGGPDGRAAAFDAAGDLWITGYLHKDEVEPMVKLGLWRYCFHDGTIKQTATYGPGAIMGAGLGVRELNGRVYVAGYTSTVSLTTPSLGLALWVFDAQGSGPIAGPFVRPDYLRDTSDVGAKLEVAGGALFGSGQRTAETGQNDLVFLKYDASGRVGVERRASLGSQVSLAPQAMVTAPDGTVAVAVSARIAEPGGEQTRAGAVFRYRPENATFVDARIDSALSGGINGAAYAGSQLWLAVDGSTAPRRFAGDETLAVTDVLVSSAPPPLAARLHRVIGGPGAGPGQFDGPAGVAVAPFGNSLFVADSRNFRVQRLSLDGKFLGSFGSRGSGPGQFGGSVLPALGPAGEGTAEFGRLAVADPGNHRIQRWDEFGGFMGAFGSQGSGPGQFESLFWIAVDMTSGRIYASDETLHRVQIFANSGGFLGTFGSFGRGPGQFDRPRGVAVPKTGPAAFVFVVDAGNKRIQKFDQAGRFMAEWPVPGFVDPQGAHAADGFLYVGDPGLGAVHVFQADGTPLGALDAGTEIGEPMGLGSDPAGRLYVADSKGNRVVVLSRLTADQAPPAAVSDLRPIAEPYLMGLEFTAPGNDGNIGRAALYELRFSRTPIATLEDFAAAEPAWLSELPAPAGQKQVLTARGLAPGATYYFALRTVDSAANASPLALASAATLPVVPVGAVATVAGRGDIATSVTGTFDSGIPATLAGINAPRRLAAAPDGFLYIVQDVAQLLTPQRLIWKVYPQTQRIERAVQANGFSGDGGPAALARTRVPADVAIAPGGHVLIADTENNRVRRIDAGTGIITTIAGAGVAGFAGDDGSAVSALLNRPRAVAADASGNVFIADGDNNKLRMVDAQTGAIATLADVDTSTDVALACHPSTQDVYIANPRDGTLRRFDRRLGSLTTVLGGLAQPAALAFDPLGRLYLAESAGHRVRRLGADGNLEAVLGTGLAGLAPVGASALGAPVSRPSGLALDAERGILYVSDSGNARALAVGVAPFVQAASAETVGGLPELALASTAPFTITAVSTAATESTVALREAAGEGLLLVGNLFDLTRADPGATARLTFRFDPSAVADVSAIAIWRYDGVAWSSTTVLNQVVTIENGVGTVTAELVMTSLYALFIPDPRPASVAATIEPGTINLKSEGKTVKLSLNVTGARTATEIDPASVRIARVNDQAVSPLFPLAKGQEVSGSALTLKFDRQAFIGLLPPSTQARVTVDGRYSDGVRFAAEALVRTLHSSLAKASTRTTVVHPAEGAAVELAAGSLAKDEEISVLAVTAPVEGEKEVKTRAAEVVGKQAIGKAFEFGPEGTQFAIPVTLTLPYDPDEVKGVGPDKLQIAYWNPKTSAWEPLPTAVDEQRRVVTAQTSHFSQYQVLAPPPSPAAAPPAAPAPASAAFGLVDVYAFPNPARGKNPTIRVQVGAADSVILRFYDVSGHQISEGGLTAWRTVDDGNGKGPQPTFDYVWDVSGVGSGVYIYTVTAKKAGQGDARATKRVAVIR